MRVSERILEGKLGEAGKDLPALQITDSVNPKWIFTTVGLCVPNTGSTALIGVQGGAKVVCMLCSKYCPRHCAPAFYQDFHNSACRYYAS
jgi:hypothetical protein